jgi:hypothetical protein
MLSGPARSADVDFDKAEDAARTVYRRALDLATSP